MAIHPKLKSKLNRLPGKFVLIQVVLGFGNRKQSHPDDDPEAMDNVSTQLETTPVQSPLNKLLASDSSGSRKNLQAYFTTKMVSLGAESGELESLEGESHNPRESQSYLIAITPHQELTVGTIPLERSVPTVKFLDTALNPSEDSISVREAPIKRIKLADSSSLHSPPPKISSQRPSSLVPSPTGLSTSTIERELPTFMSEVPPSS